MTTTTVAELEQILREDKDLPAARAATLSTLLSETRLQDVIALVERVPTKRAAVVLRLLNRARALEVFDALDAAHQADLVNALADDDVYHFFDELDPDDRVSLLDELPAEIADALLRTLDKGERDITGVLLGYPRGSVGRRMSPEVPVLHDSLTVGETMEELRRIANDVETIYSLPVIAPDRTLRGMVSLRQLFTSPTDALLSEVMVEPVFAHATEDAEETARWFMALDFLALPVVDESSRLVGVLTFDDAQDILEEADDEDTARSGAHEPLQRPYMSTPLFALVRSRIVWLLVLALSALLTVRVLDAFEGTLTKAVVLSLFIPLLTGTGGNTGNQAATTVTRALALGDVHKRDILAVMWRELRVGAFLGSILGLLGFVLAAIVYGLPIGIVIGSTLLAVCMMSATVGGAMPLIAKTVGADPAVFSNPFISTFCDATGLIIYFFIAKAVLGI